MTQQRQNPRALAAARILENLATALPAYRDMLHDQLRVTTGFADHTPGAAPATITPSRPLEGRCTANVLARVFHRVDNNTTGLVSELIDCGRSRPCPEHDRPVTLTPTEHTAQTRTQLRAELDDIDQVITTITLLATALLQRARHATPLAKHKPERCDATGREGALDWADPACHDVPARGPLCNRCSKAEYRWRVGRGLPKRTDGVYSQPAAADVPH